MLDSHRLENLLMKINYNSGIGSNGLTSARHDILDKYYAENFKESYDNNLADEVVYIGKHKISEAPGLLSPTRTFAPLIKNFWKIILIKFMD